MRHLEQNLATIQDDVEKLNCRMSYLENLEDIKEDIPIILEDGFMKNEFASDEESLINANIGLDINDVAINDIDSDDEEISEKNGQRKSRRKPSTPQKAVSINNLINNNHYLSNHTSSESSQDLSEDMKYFGDGSACGINESSLLMSDNENGAEVSENDDLININEDIFRDLKEEVEGEKLDDEILDNVKIEWRAHWGIKCNMCEQVFPYKSDFDKHYHLHYNLVPVYTCTFCNKTTEKYSTFRSHCYRHITEGRFKCDICPKAFSLQSMLHVHILSKHTKAKPFICEECGKSFVTKPGLKIHLKKHKTETKEDYPCVECGKILHTRGGLTSHMNVHRMGRRFMCDVCGKTFTQKVNMQQHVKQHTGDKPYCCDKCGKSFAEKSHLARHYSFHSEERPYKCDVCQKMYKTERCLKVHSLVHSAARPFVCMYCSKGFLSSTKLKQHYNIHTGERPYKCKYCERTFTNYPNWLKHTRRRHKVDHKTGEELEPKSKNLSNPPEKTAEVVIAKPEPIPQEIIPIQPTENPENLINNIPNTDQQLTKTDDLLLQQGFVNFPFVDDKIIFPQQIDLFGSVATSSSGTSMGLLVPYFQTTMPNQTIISNGMSTSIPLQLNDLMHNATYIQTLPCD